MAIFQGARLRPVALPTRSVEHRSARIVSQAPVRPVLRIRPQGLLMAAILTATMLGLVYLTQTLASNATTLEIRQLAASGQGFQSQLLNQRSKIETETDSVAIVRAAKNLGLVQLDDALVLAAP